MAAIKKDKLEQLEKEHGLELDNLTYQQRCSRIAAVQRGEVWIRPKEDPTPTTSDIKDHPLYGKRILITPMMRPDAKRNLAFDEVLGPEIQVREFEAGERIYGAPEETQQMVGDYEIVHVDKSKQVVAKTTFPKIGTEISMLLGKELVPVVRGNNGERGYIWSFPTQVVQVEDTMIQLYGLKTLIQEVFPQLLSKFSGKPIMSYIDGVTLAANIPMTEALLREETRKELIDERAGIRY
jgi:hypothetical protein